MQCLWSDDAGVTAKMSTKATKTNTTMARTLTSLLPILLALAGSGQGYSYGKKRNETYGKKRNERRRNEECGGRKNNANGFLEIWP